MEHLTQISRPRQVTRIQEAIAASPIAALLGPRQCGKTWLVRGFANHRDNYFDLHEYVDRVRLEDSNFKVLDGLDGVVVIDEAQEKPELFQKLRVLADRPERQTRFVITGSASPDIVRGVSESLAGRIRLLPMGGFACDEVGWENWETLWLRGGYPRAYLHELPQNSLTWRLDYITQFLAKDLRLLADTKMSGEQLRRLLQMMANYHGQYWNHSKAAEVIGVNYKTVQRHLEIFKGAFVTRELPPFFENAGKRLRMAPKIYLRDTGLLHAMLMLRDLSQLQSHPVMGASWEGFCIEQIICLSEAREEECFTWSVQNGAEVDLVMVRPAGRFGFEFKVGDAPQRTKSMMTALQDLKLKKLFVIYPGNRDYALDETLEVVGITNLMKAIAQLG